MATSKINNMSSTYNYCAASSNGATITLPDNALDNVKNIMLLAVKNNEIATIVIPKPIYVQDLYYWLGGTVSGSATIGFLVKVQVSNNGKTLKPIYAFKDAQNTDLTGLVVYVYVQK